MKTVKCASCGAPFEEVPGDDALRCDFCGAINERTIMRRPPVPPPPRPQPPPFPSVDIQGVHVLIHPQVRRGSGIGRTLSCMVLLMLIVLGASSFAIWSGFRPARFSSSLPPLSKMPFGPRNRTLAELRELHEGGRRGHDIAPPSGGYARLDAVTQLPWAQKAAQAWQADARLDRIDVSRVKPDGTVDVAGDADAEVLYRFVSPSRTAEYWRQADIRENAAAECELWIIAKGGGAHVQLITSRPSRTSPAAPAPQVLSLARTLERSRSKLPSRPFYKGYMIHSGREGWVWYFSTLSGRENIPRVRARDGRTWPW
jgi:DNA-directed RNA polymerase subunit RPC12/RpoP